MKGGLNPVIEPRPSEAAKGDPAQALRGGCINCG